MTCESAEETVDRLDVNAYLRRIGYSGELRPSRRVLDGLHLAHVTHVPFENLDVLLKRPILLDIGSLQAKLVTAGRGGYCFEQNGLFAAVLRKIGFKVTNLAARGLYRVTRTRPRTHRISLVEVEARRVIADVGYGAAGLFMPVDLDMDSVSRQFSWDYRVIERDGLRLLQSVIDGVWTDLYEFSLEPQLDVDYEMANYYVSTSPDSHFLNGLIVQRLTPEARHTLRGLEYIMDRGTDVTSCPVDECGDLNTFIAETFGLNLPDGYRFEPGETGIQIQPDHEITRCTLKDG